jgi:hypothetical protein
MILSAKIYKVTWSTQAPKSTLYSLPLCLNPRSIPPAPLQNVCSCQDKVERGSGYQCAGERNAMQRLDPLTCIEHITSLQQWTPYQNANQSKNWKRKVVSTHSGLTRLVLTPPWQLANNYLPHHPTSQHTIQNWWTTTASLQRLF